jgi:hypothetical protein
LIRPLTDCDLDIAHSAKAIWSIPEGIDPVILNQVNNLLESQGFSAPPEMTFFPRRQESLPAARSQERIPDFALHTRIFLFRFGGLLVFIGPVICRIKSGTFENQARSAGNHTHNISATNRACTFTQRFIIYALEFVKVMPAFAASIFVSRHFPFLVLFAGGSGYRIQISP